MFVDRSVSHVSSPRHPKATSAKLLHHLAGGIVPRSHGSRIIVRRCTGRLSVPEGFSRMLSHQPALHLDFCCTGRFTTVAVILFRPWRGDKFLRLIGACSFTLRFTPGGWCCLVDCGIEVYHGCGSHVILSSSSIGYTSSPKCTRPHLKAVGYVMGLVWWCGSCDGSVVVTSA